METIYRGYEIIDRENGYLGYSSDNLSIKIIGNQPKEILLSELKKDIDFVLDFEGEKPGHLDVIAWNKLLEYRMT